MLIMQIWTALTHRIYSCKFYFKIKNPAQSCTIYDISGYLLNPFDILLKVAKNGSAGDIKDFSQVLILDFKIMIAQVFVISSLPFFFVYYQFNLIKKLKKNRKNACISDYVIMMTDFESKEFKRSDLEKYFTSLLQQAGFDQKVRVLKVEEVTSNHSVKEIEESLKEAELEGRSIENALKGEGFSESEKYVLRKYEKKVKNITSKLSSKNEKMKKKELKNRIAFILLSNQLLRDKILAAGSETFSRNFSPFRSCKRKRTQFRLHIAPEPSQIVWKNIGYSSISKVLAQILLIGLALATIVVLCFLLNQILFLLTDLLWGISNPAKLVLGPKWAIFIYTVLELNFSVIKMISYKVFCFSLFSSKDISSCYRTNILAFLKYFTLFNISQVLTKRRDHSEDRYLRCLFLLSEQIILQGVMRLLGVRHITKYFKMILYGCFYKKKKILMPQKHLNQIFEKPKCEIELMYSINLYLLILLSSFCFYMPIGIPLCFFYLITNMFVDRFLFYRFYARPSEKKNLAKRLLLSSGFLLKSWYFNHFPLTHHWSTPDIPESLKENGLGSWMNFMNFFFLGMLMFPFEFLLRLEYNFLEEREIRKRVAEEDCFEKDGGFGSVDGLSDGLTASEASLTEGTCDDRFLEAFEKAYCYLGSKNQNSKLGVC